MTGDQLKPILEAALLAADRPLSLDHLLALFDEAEQPERKLLREVLDALAADCAGRGVELREVASGWRYQVRRDYAPWVTRLWEDRPPRYSRALLETLALIAYRQPITRAEIEEIRGVSVSSNIVKTLLEREWVRVVGHRDVPGRPAMYATTRQFLDYFNLKSLEELPPLAAIRDLDVISAELELPLSGEPPMAAGADDLGDEEEAPRREEPEGGGEVWASVAPPEPGREGAEAAETPGGDEGEATGVEEDSTAEVFEPAGTDEPGGGDEQDPVEDQGFPRRGEA
ncbi:condensin subunit ScpB [Thioalbus denitrificans]|uniref:Condensin subunit ScpB n=1 Tax=Thioalbus denitrificans TaxID=547122 RepID=A0A369BW43_9GAMM|nr:condensin subunit ScpB [Thioalbus denitrificans]